MKDRHLAKDIVEQEEELLQWQKELLDHRMMLLQEHPDSVTPVDTFLAEMRKEADE